MKLIRHTPRNNARCKPRYNAAYAKIVRKRRITCVISAIIMVILAGISLGCGSSGLDVPTVLAALTFQAPEYAQTVVWSLRMPHVLCAIIGGITLAAAGCAYQSSLRNPLASASTLGIAQGAAFGASIAIIVLGAGNTSTHDGVTFTNPYITALCAFIGASLSSVVIYVLSRVRELTAESVVLCGVALSALFAGSTALVQYFADDTQVAAVVFWMFGSLRRVSYNEVALMGVIAVICCIFFFFQRWKCNALEAGEGCAHALGINVGRTRIALLIMASLGSSIIIAFCGTINFIGLVAPHIMRRIIGSDYRSLFVCSALVGACLLQISDLIAANTIPSVVLPISSITSFIGAPLFIFLLLKRSKR